MSPTSSPQLPQQRDAAADLFSGSAPVTLNYEFVIKQMQPKNALYQMLSKDAPTYEWPDGAIRENISFLRSKLENSPDGIKDAVTIDPGIMHGNPVFRGTRVPVYQIIEELADGTPLEELPDSFPSLTLERVQAGLDFTARLLRIFDE